MFSYIQIFLCIASLYSATSKPFLGELNFKKNLELEFKPPLLPHLKPFGFLKEILTPFGKFGIKHGIEKRDLDSIKTVKLEKDSGSVPPILPGNRYEVEENINGPFEPTPAPYRPMPVTAGMGPELEIDSIRTPPIGWIPRNVSPISAPPNPPVVITPPPPRPIGPGPGQQRPGGPPKGFYTDIGRDELINEYLKTVERENVIPPITENHIVQEKPKPVEPPVQEPENPFVRGSRLALYFSNILLDVLTRFMGGARQPGGIEGVLI